MDGFTIENGVLTAYSGNAEAVTIPEGVTVIGRDAFRNNKTIESVYVPDSVTMIENRAFSSCTRLKNVQVGNGLRSLGWHVFSGCVALESIVLPGTLKSINVCTFKGCTALKEIILQEGTVRISESAFSRCRSLESIVLPASLREVKRYAFGKCSKLKTVTFLADREIGIHINSFWKTSSTLTFVWPHRKNFTEERAAGFEITEDRVLTRYYGTQKNVTIPASVNAIGPGAFSLSRTIESIDAPGNVMEAKRAAMGWMPSLKQVSFAGIRRLGAACFWASTGLVQVSLPSSLEEVGEDCFGHCRSLEELDLRHTDAVFKGRIAPMAYHLKRFALPEHMKEIPEMAFYYCRSLEDITIPEEVCIIKDDAFVGCSSLKAITVPDSVRELHMNAFDGCDSLEKIILRSSATVVVGTFDSRCKAQVVYEE